MAGSRALSSRTNFPAKPHRLFLDKRQPKRVSARRFDLNRESIDKAENVNRGIECFYALIGDSDEEEFHGFSDIEITRSQDKLDQLTQQADITREEIWSSRGILLNTNTRKVIRQQGLTADKYQPLSRKIDKKNKDQTVPIKQVASVENNKKINVKQKPKAKCLKIKPKSSKNNKRKQDQLIPVIQTIVKKPRTQIQIPSWRSVEYPISTTLENDNGDEIEDVSDIAFVIRHNRAEEEEQLLWEKWQAKRHAEGEQAGGRSKSSRWREGIGLASEEELNAPRLRSQRISSLLSDTSSTPGRLSPATIERVKEICVESSPSPTPCSSPSNSPSTSRKDLKPLLPKSPKSRNCNTFNSTDSIHRRLQGIPSDDEKDGCTSVGQSKCDSNLNCINPSYSLRREVLAKDITETVNNIVRRSKSDTSGMRRTSSRDDLTNIQKKNTKENLANQLMDSINRISNSSGRFSNSSSVSVPISQVLKDSNVDKTSRLVHQLGRQATKKTILSHQKPIFFRNDYPLRSQSISRRTRQGAKR